MRRVERNREILRSSAANTVVARDVYGPVPMRRSRRTLLVAFMLLAIVAAVVLSAASRATPHVRDQVMAAFNDRFQSHVVLDGLQVSVFPRPEVHGSGLIARWEGRTDVPPIVRVGGFSASAGVLGLLGTPVRLRTVTLDRLEIHIPPGGVRTNAGGTAARTAASGETDATPAKPSASRSRPRLTIDEIVAHAAQLQIASKEQGKLPRVFDIHDLHIFGYGERDGAEFRASLTNPVPKGDIETKGRFGPWHARQPRNTPLAGEYVFSNANLNSIKGLGGTLSSRGTYSGVLERIEVKGQTQSSDFSVDIAGRPVPLTTRFTAIVNGTNGNTQLEQVDATVFESHIHAKGAVVRTTAVEGRHVALDVSVDRARLEDLLKLAMKAAKPPVTGAVRINTRFFLPAGEADVVRRLRLDGDFALDHARFTSFNVQKRINTLSEKGRGLDPSTEGGSVVSQLRGRFTLKSAALTFSNLTFSVPGAVVQLAGTYHLERESLDFTGHLLLDASLRETTSGIKSVLAAIAQPFFRRPGGGSKIPIRVGGTPDRPEFGLDVKRALLPG